MGNCLSFLKYLNGYESGMNASSRTMSAAFTPQPVSMSKKANRFERSSGWTSRPGGGAEKKATGRPQRRDLSEGTRRMADGSNEPQAGEFSQRNTAANSYGRLVPTRMPYAISRRAMIWLRNWSRWLWSWLRAVSRSTSLRCWT